jgi:hypothetical protein
MNGGILDDGQFCHRHGETLKLSVQLKEENLAFPSSIQYQGFDRITTIDILTFSSISGYPPESKSHNGRALDAAAPFPSPLQIGGGVLSTAAPKSDDLHRCYSDRSEIESFSEIPNARER